jgi:hypothetical protein
VFGQAAGLISLREAVREQLLALLVEFGQLPGREPADVLCSLLLQLGHLFGGECGRHALAADRVPVWRQQAEPVVMVQGAYG